MVMDGAVDWRGDQGPGQAGHLGSSEFGFFWVDRDCWGTWSWERSNLMWFSISCQSLLPIS